MSFMAVQRAWRGPAESGSAERPGAPVFAAVHIEAACTIVEHLSPLAAGDEQATTAALEAYAREAGLGDDPEVASMLGARVAALGRWTAAHDPGRQSDAAAVLEAAARFPLTKLNDHVGFEPGGFQELVLFIEELPW